MDGFLHVVRCFEDANIPHPAGGVDPGRDIATMDAELLLNDLIAVERKLERLADERRKGGGRERGVIDREIALFERLQSVLNEEIPLRELEFSPEEERSLSGYGLLTLKSMQVLLNLAEGQVLPDMDYRHTGCALVDLQGKLEMEIAQLSAEDAAIFMQEYGIQEAGLSRVIHCSYDLMGLLSFFTVGPEEVHAWTLRRGATAYEAAGEIHTDLQKGFIRAEVIPFDELVALGGLNEARAKGKLRLEGKEYIVHDGEIVHIRFNV
jgi:hypothetical protein